MDFRNLFIEHARVVNLKKQMRDYTQVFGAGIKKAALRGAARTYREFRVLPDNDEDAGKPLTLANGKKWFRDRLKWISDRIMEFSEDDAWREKIQKQGKKGAFVLDDKRDEGGVGGEGGGKDGGKNGGEDGGEGGGKDGEKDGGEVDGKGLSELPDC